MKMRHKLNTKNEAIANEDVILLEKRRQDHKRIKFTGNSALKRYN